MKEHFFPLLQALYGLDILSIEERKPGKIFLVSAKHGRFIIKRKEKLSRLPFEQTLLAHISSCGVPAQVLLETKDSSLHFDLDGCFYSLYSFVDGFAIVDRFAPENEKYLPLFTSAIARLHLALASFKPPEQKEHDLLKTLNEYALPKIYTIAAPALLPVIEKAAEFLKGAVPAMPRQYIHRDPHEGNILMNEQGLAGFIDFELSYHCVRLFDLCYFCTGFLQEGFEDAEKREQWLKLLPLLFRGYQAVIPLSALEKRAIPPVMAAIQIICAAHCAENNLPRGVRQNLDMLEFIGKRIPYGFEFPG